MSPSLAMLKGKAMPGLIDGFIDNIIEGFAKTQAKNLTTSWIEAGYIEPAKAPELEAGMVDMVQVALGMAAKGSEEQK